MNDAGWIRMSFMLMVNNNFLFLDRCNIDNCLNPNEYFKLNKHIPTPLLSLSLGLRWSSGTTLVTSYVPPRINQLRDTNVNKRPIAIISWQFEKLILPGNLQARCRVEILLFKRATIVIHVLKRAFLPQSDHTLPSTIKPYLPLASIYSTTPSIQSWRFCSVGAVVEDIDPPVTTLSFCPFWDSVVVLSIHSFLTSFFTISLNLVINRVLSYHLSIQSFFFAILVGDSMIESSLQSGLLNHAHVRIQGQGWSEPYYKHIIEYILTL